MDNRGVFAVLGVSKMRDEVGEGHGEVAELQNTCTKKVPQNCLLVYVKLTSSSS